MEEEKTAMAMAASTSRKRKPRDGGSGNSKIEQLRRKNINEHYSTLNSLVPNLFPKATKTKVMDETINYIKFLENVISTFKRSQRRANLARSPSVLSQHNCSSTVEISKLGKTSFFGISFVSRPMAVTKVLEVFERYEAEILAASVVNEFGVTRINVTSVATEDESLESIKMDLLSI